jgi:hypothetical protein
MHLLVLQADANVSEEHAASIFRVQVCFVTVKSGQVNCCWPSPAVSDSVTAETMVARVEASSNTSTVALRVVGGDEKGT